MTAVDKHAAGANREPVARTGPHPPDSTPPSAFGSRPRRPLAKTRAELWRTGCATVSAAGVLLVLAHAYGLT